jgi:hypothetical protein
MSQALILDQKLRGQIQTERKITHEILLTIQTIDITRSYLELGYSSLYDYLLNGHGYSEGAANRRISAARLLKQIPEIASQIQDGKLNLSQLAQAQSAMNQEERKTKKKISREKKKQALGNLIGKNKFDTQKSLIEDFENFELSKPKVIPAKNKKVQVHLEFEEKDWDKVQNLLAYMSHKVPDKKVESALLYWAVQIEAKMKMAAQAEEKKIQADSITDHKEQKHANLPPKRRSKNIRRSIPSRTRHLLLQKAQHRCEYVSPFTGKKCANHSFLDIDHITPMAHGGNNNQKNLRILCRAHNHLMAKQMHLSGVF